MKRLISTALIIGVFALVSFAATETARAQCGAVTVINNMGVSVGLCLATGPAAVPYCVVVPPGISVQPLPFVANPTGVVSAGGNFYAFGPVPVVTPPPGCTPCIALRTPGGIVCGQVCFDAVNCVVTISPCGPPCLP